MKKNSYNILYLLAALFCSSQSILAQEAEKAATPSPAELAPLSSQLSPQQQVSEDLEKEQKQPKIVIESASSKDSSEVDPFTHHEELEKKVKPFILKDIVIEDAHSFSSQELQELHREYIGKKITAHEIGIIQGEMHRFYLQHGYLLTHCYAPLDNNFKDGVLKLKIINGGIRKVHFLGAGESTNLINEYQKKIVATYPVTKKSVIRYKKLIDLLPGYEVKLIKIVPVPAKERKDMKEYADVVIVAQKSSNKVKLSLDNKIRKKLGDYRANATVQMFSPFKQGEQIDLIYTTSSKSKAYKSYGLIYQQPINTEGTVLKFVGSYTLTNMSTINENYMKLSKKDDKSTDLAVQISHPFILTNKFTLSAFGELDYQVYNRYYANPDDLNVASPFSHEVGSEASLGTIVRYDDNIKGINYAVLSYAKSLPNSKRNTYIKDFLQEKYNYNRYTSYLYRFQPIYDKFSASASLYSQYSDRALPVNRSFSIGGEGFVRGYGDRFISASKGSVASLELHYMWPTKYNYLRFVDFFGFYDYGKLFAVGSDEKKNLEAKHLSSVGYGVKTYLAGNLRANVEVGYALNNFPAKYAGDLPIKKGRRNTTFSIEHVVEW